MDDTIRELGFDVAVTAATGLALAAYMLGLFVDPLQAVALGGGLVVVGAGLFAPRETWTLALVLGVGAVVLAGLLVPRIVVELTTATDEMLLTVGLSTVVLLVTFVVLHLLAFRPRPARSP